MLDLSKVEAGQVELEVAPFAAGVARAGRRDGARTSNEGRCPASVTLAANRDVDLVTGDERRIRQVIFNLLSNGGEVHTRGWDRRRARDAGQREGEGLGTAPGPGIAVEDLERIFEEFQQTDAGLEQREGTGLGLALSKRLVELHGGRIWVDGELGKGSTFVFAGAHEARLAMDGAQILVRRGQREEHEARPGRPPAAGYRTLEATTGGRAVELAAEVFGRFRFMDIPASRTSTASRHSVGFARTRALPPCRCLP